MQPLDINNHKYNFNSLGGKLDSPDLVSYVSDMNKKLLSLYSAIQNLEERIKTLEIDIFGEEKNG